MKTPKFTLSLRNQLEFAVGHRSLEALESILRSDGWSHKDDPKPKPNETIDVREWKREPLCNSNQIEQIAVGKNGYDYYFMRNLMEPIIGKPGTLFEDFAVASCGHCRRYIRVKDGKEQVIAEFAESTSSA